MRQEQDVLLGMQQDALLGTSHCGNVALPGCACESVIFQNAKTAKMSNVVFIVE